MERFFPLLAAGLAASMSLAAGVNAGQRYYGVYYYYRQMGEGGFFPWTWWLLRKVVEWTLIVEVEAPIIIGKLPYYLSAPRVLIHPEYLPELHEASALRMHVAPLLVHRDQSATSCSIGRPKPLSWVWNPKDHSGCVVLRGSEVQPPAKEYPRSTLHARRRCASYRIRCIDGF
jgi:hypothetical protein